MSNELKAKLFKFAADQKLTHGMLAGCITIATGITTSRSTVAAWARGARSIGAARAAIIREKMGL